MLFLDNVSEYCETIMPLIRLIKNGVIPIIQIGIPIILIILGMLDLGKAVVASKEDEIKTAQKMLIKRAIYAIAIFFVVLIVTLVFDLLGSAGTDDNADYGAEGQKWSQCWKKA
jgi:hypothetical protein